MVWGFGVVGFWDFGVLGFWGLGFGVLGFWGFGFWAFRVLGFRGLSNCKGSPRPPPSPAAQYKNPPKPQRAFGDRGGLVSFV